METRLSHWIVAALLGLTIGLAAAADDVATAHATLRRVVTEESGWVKVHAAEVLNTYGGHDEVRTIFAEEARRHGGEAPYRIGVWRVLARAATTRLEKEEWISRIEAGFRDERATDRLHALESLAKLGWVARGEALVEVRRWRAKAGVGDAVFGDWVLAIAGEKGARENIGAALAASEPVARLRAAHILRSRADVTVREKALLAAAAGVEPRESPGYVYVIGAAWALDADPARKGEWRGELERIIRTGTPGAAHAAWHGLLGKVAAAEVNRIAPNWQNAQGDAAIGAAWAVLAAGEPSQLRR